MSKRLKLAGALVFALALAAVTAGSIAQAGSGTAATANGEDGCKLNGHGTEIKHVIYLQFDNTHLFRDRSNFASDLEQMPHLTNFLRDNGTLSDNEHTILISHTAGGFELLRVLQVQWIGWLFVLVQVLDRHHGRRQSSDFASHAVGGHELQHGQ